jgi:hypothetical protein
VHSPEPIARKNALARQSWPRLRTLPSERQAQTPHRRVDRTHCASAKPHWEPDYARGKSARGAFLHVLTGVPSPILPFSCELCRSSFPPSLPFLLLFLSLASHPSFTSSIFPQLFCRFTTSFISFLILLSTKVAEDPCFCRTGKYSPSHSVRRPIPSPAPF